MANKERNPSEGRGSGKKKLPSPEDIKIENVSSSRSFKATPDVVETPSDRRSEKKSDKPSEKTSRTGRTALSALKAAPQVQCPYCGRSFNEKVAARHIPNCKFTKHRPRPPPSKEDILAKQEERRKSTKRNISVKQRVTIPRERLTSFYLQQQQELNESRREHSRGSSLRQPSRK